MWIIVIYKKYIKMWIIVIYKKDNQNVNPSYINMTKCESELYKWQSKCESELYKAQQY